MYFLHSIFSSVSPDPAIAAGTHISIVMWLHRQADNLLVLNSPLHSFTEPFQMFCSSFQAYGPPDFAGTSEAYIHKRRCPEFLSRVLWKKNNNSKKILKNLSKEYSWVNSIPRKKKGSKWRNKKMRGWFGSSTSSPFPHSDFGSDMVKPTSGSHWQQVA